MGLLTYNGRLLAVNGRLTADPACCCSVLCPALNAAVLELGLTGFPPAGAQPFGITLEDYGHLVMEPETSLYGWHEVAAFETLTTDGSGCRHFYWVFFTCGNPDETALLTAFKEYIRDTMGDAFAENVFLNAPLGVDIRTPAGILEMIDSLVALGHAECAESPTGSQTNFFDSNFGCPC